jgi:putative transposase
VTKSHSRPHCSNDRPVSGAQFKTLKYRPDFPDRFGCLEDARSFCAIFYRW